MNLKDRLKRLFGRIEIENLMTYAAATMAIIFVGNLLTEGMMTSYLYFDRAAILDGQVWRVLTFLVLPRTNSPIFIVFSIYFYYMIGKTVENEWGSHNLTVYLLLGAVLLIISGFVTGYTDAEYLYFSLFLVYAHLNPHHIFMLLMVIPVEARVIAAIDAIFMALSFLQAFPRYRDMPMLALGIQLSVLIAFLVFGIFFGKDYLGRYVNRFKHRDFIREMKRNRIKMSEMKRNRIKMSKSKKDDNDE